MTTEQFSEIWADWQLRQYLVDICKACTRNIELQEDCLQEAALRISREPGDKTVSYYAEVGRRAIIATRSKERRYHSGKDRLLRKYNSYWREQVRQR